MTGVPRATQVQLSPFPTSAMSDQHNKTQCVGLCSQEQLGGLVEKKQQKKKTHEQGRGELCITKSYASSL